MSVQASGRETLTCNGSEAPPPLRLLERPPARSPRTRAPAPAPQLCSSWLLAWARRQLGWAVPGPDAQDDAAGR